MVAVEMPHQALRHVIYSRRAYLVPRRDGRLIAGSTTELVGYDRRLTPAGIASIVGRAEEIMPAFTGQPVLEMWAGLRPRAADCLPVLGADPVISGLIHATGHYRNGVLLAPLTGQLVADLVTGTEPAVDLAPFSPARFEVGSD
jgi:glycine oxidase